MSTTERAFDYTAAAKAEKIPAAALRAFEAEAAREFPGDPMLAEGRRHAGAVAV